MTASSGELTIKAATATHQAPCPDCGAVSTHVHGHYQRRLQDNPVGPVEVNFETNEPAEIYYTLDGSRPDFDSPKMELTGVRGELETLLIEETTTVHWFVADIAGNTEGGYAPDSNARNHRRGTWTITD